MGSIDVVTAAVVSLWALVLAVAFMTVRKEDRDWNQYVKDHDCYMVQITMASHGEKEEATVCPN